MVLRYLIAFHADGAASIAINTSMGLGFHKNSATVTGTPNNQTRGLKTAVMQPPLNGGRGMRLNKFKKKPE